MTVKKTIDEKLNSALDILTPATDMISELLPIESTPAPDNLTRVEESNDIDEDYEYARRNLKGLIENGKIAMENIIFLAKEGESPRAYEVVGQLIKTLADTNKDLLELGKKAREAKGTDKSSTQAPVQQNVNAVFVGSTAELQKLIKGK